MISVILKVYLYYYFFSLKIYILRSLCQKAKTTYWITLRLLLTMKENGNHLHRRKGFKRFFFKQKSINKSYFILCFISKDPLLKKWVYMGVMGLAQKKSSTHCSSGVAVSDITFTARAAASYLSTGIPRIDRYIDGR